MDKELNLKKENKTKGFFALACKKIDRNGREGKEEPYMLCSPKDKK